MKYPNQWKLWFWNEIWTALEILFISAKAFQTLIYFLGVGLAIRKPKQELILCFLSKNWLFYFFSSRIIIHMKYGVWRSNVRYFVLGNCPQNCEILTLQFQETPNRYWFHAWKYIAIPLRDRPLKTSVVAF